MLPADSPPPLPGEVREAARLRALRRYAILDTEPEPAFERAVGLAARLFGVPLAFVSLVDEGRQWYKACHGLDVRETRRSFCAHAVEEGGVMVVPDATLDPRFRDDPLVTGAPHLRFYAGAPLEVPGGHRLGTLCILDPAPRPDLTPGERAALADLAAGVVSELELRRALAEGERREALRAAVFETALDCLVTIDRRGHVTEWNRAAEETFGYPRAEAIGQDLSALIIPERLREHHRRALAHQRPGGESRVLGRRVEVPAMRRGGAEFPCELTVTPFTVDGEPMFTAFLRDLTEHRQAEEARAMVTSHNLLRAAVDGLAAALAVKDRAGRYVLVNAAGAARLGGSPEDILGRDDAALFPPGRAEALRRQDEEVLTSGGALSGEVADPAPDSPLRTFLTTKQAYRDHEGQVVGLVETALDITGRKEAETLVREHNHALEVRVRERTRELEEAQFEVLDRLARAAELRDDETGDHVRRVARMAAGLARELGLPPEEVELVRRVAPLHDVGKIGVPDRVLLKPGRLTPEEFEVVKAHALIGGRLLSGGRSRLVQAAQEIALSHHERWNGSGYPHGLAGEQIPLLGRIVAVADVYDALTSERPYKEAWPPEAALAEIRAQAGRQFDPRVVTALERLLTSPEGSATAERSPRQDFAAD